MHADKLFRQLLSSAIAEPSFDIDHTDPNWRTELQEATMANKPNKRCRHLNYKWTDKRTSYHKVGDKVVCKVCGKLYGYIREYRR